MSNTDIYHVTAQNEQGTTIWFEVLSADLQQSVVRRLEASGFLIPKNDGGFVWLNPAKISHIFFQKPGPGTSPDNPVKFPSSP